MRSTGRHLAAAAAATALGAATLLARAGQGPEVPAARSNEPAAAPACGDDAARLRLEPPSLDGAWRRPAAEQFDPAAAPRVDLCACGCGVFDVGTSSMLPQGKGGTVWLEVDYQDQNQNWSGTSKAPAADNDDKNLRTHFVTLGMQYMFNRTWGVEAELPYDFRRFEGEGDSGVASTDWSSFGDVRLRALYTGFFDDLSAGVSAGIKLPTGNFRQSDPNVDIDRDTQIGTGSTDLLLGGFYRQAFGAGKDWTWFAQVSTDLPVLIQDHYRPGCEFDEAGGVYYSGWSYKGVDIVPLAQLIASQRTEDSGENAAHPVASGYERLFISPGIEFNFHPVMVYADVEVPVYQRMTGEQLVAPALFKVIVSYSF